jgi:lipoprotein LprA
VSVLLDPDKGLANLLTNLKDGSVAGTAQVNGVATTKSATVIAAAAATRASCN